MTSGRRRPAARLLIMVALLGLALAGCRLSQAQPGPAIQVSRRQASPAGMVVLLDRDEASALAGLRALLAGATLPGERVIVDDADSGQWLGSFRGPASPAPILPPAPAPLAAHPTQFQRAVHQQAVSRYRTQVRRALAALAARQHRLFVAWAGRVTGQLAALGRPRADSRDQALSHGFSAAGADFASLTQAGLRLGGREILVDLGFDGPLAPAGQLPGLRGVAVVVTDFPASLTRQAAVRSLLLGSGAATVVLLTRPTTGELVPVLRQFLAGKAAAAGD